MQVIVLGASKLGGVYRTRPGTAGQALAKARRWRDAAMRVKFVDAETGREVERLELETIAYDEASAGAR